MIQRKTVTTGVPAAYVRFDDGRNRSMLEDIATMLEHGIPCTLAFNWGNVASANDYPSWSDLRALVALAKKNGTEIQLIQHGNTNFQTHRTGTDGVDLDLHWELWTWQDYLDEIDPTVPEEELGLPVLGFLAPGDNNADVGIGINEHLSKSRNIIREACEYWGLEFAFGLTQPATGINPDEGVNLGFVSSSNDAYVLPASTNPQNNGGATKPGVLSDPFDIPDQFTADLGGRVIPRGVRTAGAPGPDPNSGAPGWILGEDNNGNGAEGSVDNDWDKTLQYRISGWLASSAWFGIAHHGTERTDASDVDLSTGTIVSPGHFSVEHEAWMLSQLRAKGHLRLLGAHDWAREIAGDFAEGTDLIANPTCGEPFRDIGDLACGDMPYPRGLTMEYAGRTARPNGTNSFCGSGYTDTDGDGIIDSPGELTEVFGATVGGPLGMTGGWTQRPDASGNVNAINSELGFCHLAPGLYRFEMIAEADSGTIGFPHWGLAAMRMIHNQKEQWVGLANPKDYQTAQFSILQARSSFTDGDLGNLSGGIPHKYRRIQFDFDCNPAQTWPQFMARAAYDPGAGAGVADGATDSNAFTVTGARVGGRARAFCHVPVPDGVSLAAEVTGNNEVTMTIHNDSGALWDPGSVNFTVVAEDLRPWLEHPADITDGQRWIYHFGFRMTKNSTSEARFGRPTLRLLRRYH